jgi:hypothetical protein
MEHESIEKIARRYRDEGYDVVVHPDEGGLLPPLLAGFQPDLIATRGNESVVIEIKTKRIDLSNDPNITRLAEIIDGQPGWRLDLVVLEPETTFEKMAQEGAEPSDEQLFQTLRTAEELADKGYAPSACVIAWAGLEAAMRRTRGDAELYGRATPIELMRTLYSNGFLSREQFDRLRDSFKIRSQVVHGLVPPKVDSEMVRFLTATARYLVMGEEAAVKSN